MIDGLWTAEFGTPTGMFGGGVVVFREGKIVGGDATYFYVGEYSQTGEKFRASLRVAPYIVGAPSVFSTIGHEFTLQLEGVLTGPDRATAQGHVTGTSAPKLGVKLTKRA